MDQHHRTSLIRSLNPMPSRRDVTIDRDDFDALIRRFGGATARRDFGRWVAMLGLGLAALRLPDAAAAKKKHHKKRKKTKRKKPLPLPPPPPPPPLVFNEFGCIDVGQPCQGDSMLCCSGICEGTAPLTGNPDTSHCVAHNAGVCTVDTDACELGVEVPCSANGSRSNCSITTGNAAFCAAISDEGVRPNCRSCAKDTDCQGEFGSGAACVVLGGVCTGLCLGTGRTACLPPAA